MEDAKVIIVTQARVNSTRFPEKIFKMVGDLSVLGLHLQRLKKAKRASALVVATTFETGADKIIDIAQQGGAFWHQGSTNDVLDRFYLAAKNFNPDYVVRVTSDCPLIDSHMVDEVIHMTVSNTLDYGSNTLVEEFPDGQDVEVIRWEALSKAWSEAKLKSDREHVTPFVRNNSDIKGGSLFKAKNFSAPLNYSAIRMTVDEPVDLETIEILVNRLGTDAKWEDYAEYIVNHPDKFLNQKIIRNEGYFKSIIKNNE